MGANISEINKYSECFRNSEINSKLKVVLLLGHFNLDRRTKIVRPPFGPSLGTYKVKSKIVRASRRS